MLNKITNYEISRSENIKKYFYSVNENNININCNIFKGNFYLDSYNYFPISNKNEIFEEIFKRDSNQSIEHFYTNQFESKFQDEKKNFKVFSDIFVLGSNAADNYYSNLIHFLPRLFYNTEKNVTIAIHRNLSNNFRKFIINLNKQRNINTKFLFLDDDFYSFKNSLMPQFLSLENSIKVLNNFIIPKSAEKKYEKIYLTRGDSNYRKLLNEFDIIPILKKFGYQIINLRLYTIEEQINIFSNANYIISPHGSNLANILFCKKGTQIYEIGPEFDKSFEANLDNRYKKICDIKELKYNKIIAETVDVSKHSDLSKKYIGKSYLDKGNYYKNLIVKINELKSLVN